MEEKLFQTSRCHAFGHPEICFRATHDFAAGQWLVAFLEGQVAAGTRFRASETLQVGWMITRLTAIDGGGLEICEPDFAALPISWKTGLDFTLRHLVLHRAVCDELKVELVFPSVLDVATLSPRFLDSQGGFQMSRDEPTRGDCGWVFAEPGYTAPEAQLASLYQVAIRRPEIIPFVALPVGSAVINNLASLQVTSNDRTLSARENRLLASLRTYGAVRGDA